MKRLVTAIMLAGISAAGIAQPTKTPYCDRSWCTLPKNHEAHFDPYYNGHLCENFDPKQNDFSAEYLSLQTRNSGANILKDLRTFDFSAIWPTPDTQQNGVIGLDYRRIRFHIVSAVKDSNNPLVYHVTGKSNVSGNRCDFSGQIKLTKAYQLQSDGARPSTGNLFAEYVFFEDRSQNHVGTFKGVFECFFYLDKKTGKAFLDESANVADGYYNRTYVGTWRGYNASTSKKCIWGDYRLPFTFDFDCGDGAMIVCDKYAQNGWTAFNSGGEYEVVEEKVMLKDKWWTATTKSH